MKPIPSGSRAIVCGAMTRPVPSLYGRRKTFARKRDADEFVRHLTRELTAGGVPHWVEVRGETPQRYEVFVHRFACPGGAACGCDAA